MTTTAAGAKPILLAFSGGLDTSFCVPWLAETYGRPIVTLTVNTGGIDDEAARVLAERSRTLGAVEHHLVDARPAYFEQVLKYLVMGNVRRGNLYPLCVGAERVLQAQTVAQFARAARHRRRRARLHRRGQRPGALRSRAAHARAGARDPRAGARPAFKRPEQLEYLQARKLPVPPFGAAYSVNRGLWGVTIGGKETLVSETCIPDDAWVLTRDAFSASAAGRAPHDRLRGRRALLARRREARPGEPDRAGRDDRREVRRRSRHPPRRHDHRLQGSRRVRGAGRRSAARPRIANSKSSCCPARQARIKDTLAGPYGDLVHEGQHLDPVCRDIEAFFVSTQQRVTGEVHVLFRPGVVFVEGVASKYSLMKASKGAYGESAGEWTAAEAHGFSKMLALPGIFYTRAGRN